MRIWMSLTSHTTQTRNRKIIGVARALTRLTSNYLLGSKADLVPPLQHGFLGVMSRSRSPHARRVEWDVEVPGHTRASEVNGEGELKIIMRLPSRDIVYSQSTRGSTVQDYIIHAMRHAIQHDQTQFRPHSQYMFTDSSSGKVLNRSIMMNLLLESTDVLPPDMTVIPKFCRIPKHILVDREVKVGEGEVRIQTMRKAIVNKMPTLRCWYPHAYPEWAHLTQHWVERVQLSISSLIDLSY